MPVILPLGAVAAALFALLFLVAWQEWRNTIINCLDISLPIIGHVIASAVDALLSTAYAILCYYLDRLLTPLYNLILAPIFSIVNVWDQSLAFAAGTVNALGRIQNISIPGVLSAAQTFANNVGISVLNNAVVLYNDALARISAGVAAAEHYADFVGGTAVTFAQGVESRVTSLATLYYNQALAAVHAAESEVVTYLNQQIASTINFAVAQGQRAITFAEGVALTAEQDTARALVTAEAFATTAATQIAGALITDVQTGVAVIEKDWWPDVLAGTIAVEGVLGADLPDILSGIKAIPRSVPFDLATAIAGSLALSVPMLKYLEQCGIPNCKNLGALGRELQELLSLVGDAAFLAFILEFIHDPESAANTVESTFGSVLRGTQTVARDLLNI